MQKHVHVLLKIHQVLLQGQHQPNWMVEISPQTRGQNICCPFNMQNQITKAEKGLEITTGWHLLRHTMQRCKTGKTTQWRQFLIHTEQT